MHDIDGKALHIGSDIHTYDHGLLVIKAVKEEHDINNGGALVECMNTEGQIVELRIHEHKAIKVLSWKEIAEQALNVQNACNLSGVVRSFHIIISSVRTRLGASGMGGTEEINNHPACRLFADKIAHLTGTQSLGNDEVTRAYKWAHDLTNKESR